MNKQADGVTRDRIEQLVAARAMRPCQIAEAIGAETGTVAWHLNELERCGRVIRVVCGRRIGWSVPKTGDAHALAFRPEKISLKLKILDQIGVLLAPRIVDVLKDIEADYRLALERVS